MTEMLMASAWNPDRASEIITREKAREGALLPVLHALQEAFGYIGAEAEALVAAEMNLSRADVHGVVTFYHDFRHEPAGRHVLKLCRAEACQARGGDALAAHAENRLAVKIGETTPDYRFTVEATYCLGLCASGPSAMLNDRVLARLTNDKLDALLTEAR
jgi:formate dehydrogenase subunit gamma